MSAPAGPSLLVVSPSRRASQIAIPPLFARDDTARRRFLEFFAANIRNRNTRRGYGRAVADFAAWCERSGISNLHDVEPVHVAAYVESLGRRLAAPSVKVELAAIRMLFDWFASGGIIAANPASPVRGPKHSVRRGKTPVLTAEEARRLLDSIDPCCQIGLRDRALMALMVYSFARVGAAVKMRVQDVYVQGGRTWVCLDEKGGKQHRMPCHPELERHLRAYIAGANLRGEREEYLFRTARRTKLTKRPMSQSDAWRMIRRRAAGAGIATEVCNHSFRATGITEYLRNGGKLEVAQQMANHESARTTGLYDRRNDEINLDEVKRIVI